MRFLLGFMTATLLMTSPLWIRDRWFHKIYRWRFWPPRPFKWWIEYHDTHSPRWGF